MKRKYLSIVSAVLLLAGCTNDMDEGVITVDTESIPLTIWGGIEQQYTTRVNDDGFCSGDAVGIYVVNFKNGVSGTLQDKGNQADNVKFVYDEESGRWTPESAVYYHDKTTHVDIIGYYPYSVPSTVTSYSFEVQKDQSADGVNGLMGGYEASDFLWGKAGDVTPTASRVNITFQHQMAGVQVELIEGTGFSEGEWASLDKQVLVSNTRRKATIDLSTGVVTATGEVPATGIVPAKSGEQFRAVVVPQTLDASTALFNLTVDGVPYVFRKSKAFEYHSGKLHKFTIEVSKKSASGLEFKLIGEAITAWESENITHDGTAREYVIINVPKASTEYGVSALKAAIEAAGKNFTKIKNLKVTGEINKHDFYFMRDEMGVLQYINLKEVTIAKGEIPDQAFCDKKTLVRFVFPEGITKIGSSAFYQTNLTGSLIIPNSVTEIGDAAFRDCVSLSGSLRLPKSLKKIGSSAFYNCLGLTGTLDLPESLVAIESTAFLDCNGFTGELILPENLEELGSSAFYGCRGFTGDLKIPLKIKNISSRVFSSCGFDGQLILHNGIITIEDGAFEGCKFRGELVLPENLLIIEESAFVSNLFGGELKLPSTLAVIGNYAFTGCRRLTGTVVMPEGIVSISSYVFADCSNLQGVVLPKELETIRSGAFKNCFQLNAITCHATTPPTIDATAFNGVAKDNFTVEVPEASVNSYATAPNWREFKRFAAYRNFSISRNLFRTLNAETSKKVLLRAESGMNWKIESKPDWVTVTPASGVGKTEVTITVNQLAKGSGNRTGQVVFELDGQDYRSTTTVEQYDYEYGDGDVITNQTAAKGKGVNIVFMGDCFDAKDIAEGKYLDGVNEAIEHFFAVEPYKTYREYFNVYTVIGMSADSGVGSVNTIRESKFGSAYGLQGSGALGVDENICFEYACKAPTVTEDNINITPIVLVENTFEYDGITYMWGDGSAIALVPMSQDVYPYDFRGVVQHEAGGHAFGKLGDEYIYHNQFIQTCPCLCCSHVKEFTDAKNRGWYPNLSLTGNMYDVPWSHLIFDEKYQNTVDIYEGGFFHTRGVFRSEPNSCMNNNIPYFSAISRESIVKRIMEYAGLTYSFEAWKAADKALATDEEDELTRSIPSFKVPYVSRQQQAPKFMGEKPQFKSNK